MARCLIFPEAFSDLFKQGAIIVAHFVLKLMPYVVIHPVQSPQRYLNRARKCLENAQRVTSPSRPSSLQFNHSQCRYLADELKEGVNGVENSAWPTSSKIDLEWARILKLLWRCAKEVERFIQSCRRDNWIQAAMESANMSEHVFQLSSNLKFCKFLIRNKFNPLGEGAALRALTEVEGIVFTKSESFKEIVSRDQSTLLTRLRTMDCSRNSSEHESQLVKSLSNRLAQYLSGSVQLSDRIIQYFSLRAVQNLGNGSAGTVRKSIWMGEEVAEKMFHGSDHSSFKNEVGILAGLAHPNILPLLGFAVEKERCFIVMELMDGDLSGLLEERLRQNPTLKVPFSDFEAGDIMLQSAEGILYFHGNRIVHRVLKSANILVKNGEDIDAKYVLAKVADFGLFLNERE